MSDYLSQYVDRLLRVSTIEEAEAALREAERIVTQTEERQAAGELARLRGLLWQSAGNADQAAACLREAIEWAGERNSKLYELGAARDWARAAGDPRGQPAEALAALGAVVAWFPAGLDALGLREARVLLPA